MSVHHEALDMTKPVEHEAPELELQAVTQDSLSMFMAAIGGAILGTLLTLLVLAIINGGTLSFSGGERLATFESKLNRVDQNVGAVSSNFDVVLSQVQGIESQLATIENNVRAEMSKQKGDMGNLTAAVSGLGETKEQFNSLVTALSEALGAMQDAK